MDIQLRLEQPADYRKTETVTREAFWNHFSPGCNEHYLLHIMRGNPAFLPQLDVVAVHDGRIVGNIAYMKAVIHGDDGKTYEVLSLGPIAVLPEYQRKGVGRRLIGYTRELARKMGFRAILLCGDPAYYGRQGFAAAEQFGIRTADNMYAAALQVCELYENALSGIRGRYIEDAVYEVDQDASAAFDQGFPAKEKIGGTPSQKRFQEIVAMQKRADKHG
ncbi:GNAT family N-acetyltransferase [Candidatus Soleaferrea massiliensis]|uniref:GNAT family N-acetyltransferase n=1 Tax=Candidatus Soleaferrea massiliensis TaxID=1470354 RepID=UPI00058EA0E6|nr:N-acetyltransferase [Candidatus Soleaferrea massiliensis]